MYELRVQEVGREIRDDGCSDAPHFSVRSCCKDKGGSSYQLVLERSEHSKKRVQSST